MRKLFCFLFLFLILCCTVSGLQAKKTKPKPKKKPIPCAEGTAYRKCVACGSAVRQSFRDLNVLKNRDDPASDTQEVTVAEIRKASNNEGHFNPQQQVGVRGFVASLDKGGFEESCNCGRDDLRDIHINIVASESEKANKTKFVVVEITPRWQEKFDLDDSDYDAMVAAVKAKILHKWVRFEGWMLYDIAHVTESKATAQSNTPICTGKKGEPKPCIWRATPWEVHPVTKYNVVSAP
jgi:hypothetical protein